MAGRRRQPCRPLTWIFFARIFSSDVKYFRRSYSVTLHFTLPPSSFGSVHSTLFTSMPYRITRPYESGVAVCGIGELVVAMAVVVVVRVAAAAAAAAPAVVVAAPVAATR